MWLPPPPQIGSIPSGRMAHTSLYIPELELIYVYGGIEIVGLKHIEVSYLYSYQPHLHYWRQLSSSSMSQAFHSLSLMGGALVAFGGLSNINCYVHQVTVYDISKS